MSSFIDYIENTFADTANNDTLYRYKRLVLDKMTERANEVTHTGLHDEKVLDDLIISEFPHLKENYQKFCAEDRHRRREKALNKFMIFGTIGFILALVVLYLAVSFLTDAWSQTWLLIVGGILLWVIFLLSVFIRRITALRRLFHPFARVLLALSIMAGATVVFLFTLVVLHRSDAWVIYPIAVVLMYVADGIYAYVTKQKLRIINYLIYIPAAMPMLYVVLGALDILPWHPGWLLMPLSVLIDLAMIAFRSASNAKYRYKQEVDDEWNAN